MVETKQRPAMAWLPVGLVAGGVVALLVRMWVRPRRRTRLSGWE